jgi:predicted P-loop ATPase
MPEPLRKTTEFKKKGKKEDPNYIIQAIDFISNVYDIKFNKLISDYILDGKIMQEKDYNNIWLALRKIEIKVGINDVYTIINSSHIDEIDPVQELLSRHEGQNYTGTIKALCNTVTCDNGYNNGEYDPYWFRHFFTKWFVGMVSILAKDYPSDNPLMLCLLSEKQNMGKTEFFRRLLPKELQLYYQETPIKEHKDFLIMMAQNIIIMDDELDGKTKGDVDAFKALTSKKEIKIRLPYGRRVTNMRRIATLCGTGNHMEILSDITGNRRIIPVSIINIDNAKYNEINKEHLFVEAYRMFESGYNYRLEKEDIEMLNKDEDRYTKPIMERELILQYFDPGDVNDLEYSTYLTATSMLAIMKKKSGLNNLSVYKLGRILKDAGYPQSIRRLQSVTTRVYWVKKLSLAFEDEKTN